MDEKNADCKEAEEAFKSVNETIKAHTDDDIKQQMVHAQEALEKAQRNKKHYADRQKELKKDIASIKKCIGDKQKEIEENMAKASQIFTEWIKTRRTPQQIERVIIQIKEQIKKEVCFTICKK